MPNNPVRRKAGYIKVSGGTSRAKRKDVASSLRIVNKAFVTVGQELGGGNGTPAPTYSGGSGF